MDRAAVKKKLMEFIKEYRYAAMILTAGLILMLIPFGGKEETTATAYQEIQCEEDDLQEQLAEILSAVQGAGKVKVLLTQARSEQTVYQMDIQEREDALTEDTVLVTAADRSQQGLVLHRITPKYQGAVIVCQGADKAAVRLALVEAVADATGLSTDAITVLKMK